jgi:hypothetical protein
MSSTALLLPSISGSTAATGISSTSARYARPVADRPDVDRHEADLAPPELLSPRNI